MELETNRLTEDPISQQGGNEQFKELKTKFEFEMKLLKGLLETKEANFQDEKNKLQQEMYQIFSLIPLFNKQFFF